MMKVLIITNKSDITSDFIVQNLSDLNIPFYRLNTDEIGNTIQISFDLVNNRFFIDDLTKSIRIDLLKIKSVYFRRPEITIHANNLSTAESNFIRAELSFTLEALYKILNKSYWVNTVEAIRMAENKIYQLMVAKKIGFLLPNTLLTNRPEKAYQFYEDNFNSCIIKPIKSGLLKADLEEGVIFTTKVDLNKENVKRISTCPVYLQNLVPKQADLRVTVVGENIFCALIHSQDAQGSSIDWRKADYPLKHSVHELPLEIKIKCLELTKQLNLNFGAIDLILDKDGNYIFLEINPNGQWAWIERQLNFSISHEITKLLVEGISS